MFELVSDIVWIGYRDQDNAGGVKEELNGFAIKTPATEVFVLVHRRPTEHETVWVKDDGGTGGGCLILILKLMNSGWFPEQGFPQTLHASFFFLSGVWIAFG